MSLEHIMKSNMMQNFKDTSGEDYSDSMSKVMNHMLNRIVSGMLLLAALGAPASLLRIFSTGRQPVYYVHVLVAMSIVVLFFKRHSLGIFFKSILVILLLFAIGLPAFLTFGFYSAALFWFVSGCFVAAFVFDKKVIYTLIVFVGIVIAFTATGFTTGILTLQFDANEYIQQWHAWIAIFTGTMVFAVIFVRANQAYNKEILHLNRQLMKSLDEVKRLSGLLPICASCKKVRDDKGYWNQIENYIEERSEAQFSHGICEECAEKLYGDATWYRQLKEKKKDE